ncbi:MAG: host attachment protein, partial [Alphaproteobacteria bacterium]
MDLPHDVWIAVADGAKWLVFRNLGDEKYPQLA